MMMKILIYVGDLITDLPGIFLGDLLARFLGAEVTLFHVSSKENKKKKERKQAEKIFNQARKKMGDVEIKTRVRRGNVANKILQEVDEGQYDIVVITASRIGRYPRGLSISREILEKMPCCAVIAKNPKPEIKKILMCTGGLSISESMIGVGAKVAEVLGAKVTLMHVAAHVPSMYTGLETIEETIEELLQTDTPVAKHLRKCARTLAKYDVKSELKLRHGEAVFEIAREMDVHDYDLVILGASGATTGLKELFMGNVTKEIIDLVGIPVMVVNQSHASKLSGIGD
jgi:nucleotide-binding universal stress UspA family protein